MGALHAGHLDLVQRALASHDRVVCSIFVNPLQFNNKEDYERYPDRHAEDLELLRSVGCHAFFSPKKEDLFRGFEPSHFELGGLDEHWEGPSRPGHFQGVVNVVERLFSFVRPDSAFFGEKDRQQLAIIKHVASRERWPEEIIAAPTVRAANGLALSSRNLRLSPEEQERATILFKALNAAAKMAFRGSVQEALRAGRSLLEATLGSSVDYFGIAHPSTLAPIQDWSGLTEAVALVAAQVGPVRLIDNLTLRRD